MKRLVFGIIPGDMSAFVTPQIMISNCPSIGDMVNRFRGTAISRKTWYVL